MQSKYKIMFTKAGTNGNADKNQQSVYSFLAPYLEDPYVRAALIGMLAGGGFGGLTSLVNKNRKRGDLLSNVINWALLGGLGGLGYKLLTTAAGPDYPESEYGKERKEQIEKARQMAEDQKKHWLWYTMFPPDYSTSFNIFRGFAYPTAAYLGALRKRVADFTNWVARSDDKNIKDVHSALVEAFSARPHSQYASNLKKDISVFRPNLLSGVSRRIGWPPGLVGREEAAEIMGRPRMFGIPAKAEHYIQGKLPEKIVSARGKVLAYGPSRTWSSFAGSLQGLATAVGVDMLIRLVSRMLEDKKSSDVYITPNRTVDDVFSGR